MEDGWVCCGQKILTSLGQFIFHPHDGIQPHPFPSNSFWSNHLEDSRSEREALVEQLEEQDPEIEDDDGQEDEDPSSDQEYEDDVSQQDANSDGDETDELNAPTLALGDYDDIAPIDDVKSLSDSDDNMNGSKTHDTASGCESTDNESRSPWEKTGLTSYYKHYKKSNASSGSSGPPPPPCAIFEQGNRVCPGPVTCTLCQLALAPASRSLVEKDFDRMSPEEIREAKATPAKRPFLEPSTGEKTAKSKPAISAKENVS